MKMATMRILSYLMVLVLLAQASSALYFHILETSHPKCFIEEIPDETLVVGKYKTQAWDDASNTFLPSSPGIGMHVVVTDPSQKTLMSKFYSSEGKFSFTSHSPGEHTICLQTNSTKWTSGKKLRVHLDIEVGEQAVDYAQVAAREKLTELQLRVRQLLDQVEQISKEQNYQRFREEQFRSTSESTNSRVLWWSLAQTAILLVLGYWQMRHLRGFFEAKKLV
ncbi:transmembrane emp24 domain-containing protein eca-like [Sycon ciliatum]|uniref:transmembrane emp24 domain-containing protein eca-like n=1 Tax=Sycon ciliatum TaxID=27933 RepID=UPI0020A966BA